MIGTVIEEIKASATAHLPTHIADVAALRGVSLTTAFELNDWWEEEAEILRSLNPAALGIRWEATRAHVGKATPAHTHFDHPLHLVYAYKGSEIAVVKRHMLYVAEAVVRWLRAFPTASRAAGKTITAVDPPDAGGVTIEHDLILARPRPKVEPVVIDYVWAFDVSVVFRAVDAI